MDTSVTCFQDIVNATKELALFIQENLGVYSQGQCPLVPIMCEQEGKRQTLQTSARLEKPEFKPRN